MKITFDKASFNRLNNQNNTQTSNTKQNINNTKTANDKDIVSSLEILSAYGAADVNIKNNVRFGSKVSTIIERTFQKRGKETYERFNSATKKILERITTDTDYCLQEIFDSHTGKLVERKTWRNYPEAKGYAQGRSWEKFDMETGKRTMCWIDRYDPQTGEPVRYYLKNKKGSIDVIYDEAGKITEIIETDPDGVVRTNKILDNEKFSSTTYFPPKQKGFWEGILDRIARLGESDKGSTETKVLSINDLDKERIGKCESTQDWAKWYKNQQSWHLLGLC